MNNYWQQTFLYLQPQNILNASPNVLVYIINNHRTFNSFLPRIPEVVAENSF